MNVVQLDPNLPLVDSYTRENAVVQLSKTNFGRSYQKGRVNKNWFFPVSYDDDLVRSGVAMVLGTQPYERVMLPEYGSRLYEVPFEQNDEVTNALIERFVIDAISQWEPRATILNVAISNTNDTIQINLKLKINLQTFSMDFTLDDAMSLVPLQ